jgi:hypothetical protein
MTGEDVIKIRDELRTQRAPMEAHWNDLAEVFTPFRRLGGLHPDILQAEAMFDSTPRRAAEIFANGLCSLIVPREERWAEFTAPRALRGEDDAVKWYRDATETTFEYLDASNLYEEFQESLIESPVFGTCSLYCGELDDRGELCFLHQPIGTYYLGEDSKGRVNTHVRDLSYTADQAADEFGKDALPAKIANKVGTPAGMTEKHEFIHLVTKRTGPAPKDAPEAARLPWIDMVVAVESKTVVRRSGTYEFPFAAHRYRKYGKTVWGFGPGSTAAGDARQLSFLNELADVGTEKAVFPPLLASSALEGEVAQGALEVTYYDETNSGGQNSVRELHTQANLQILEWRMKGKQQAVEQAFHVDLFKLFSNRVQERGPLTATEASLVASEKLTQFSPVYGRIMSEMIDNVLQRVFGVLFRAGVFGTPPASVAQIVNGRARVATPAITYRNRIALAMKAKDNGALLQFLELVLPVMQAFPQFGQAVYNAFESPVMIRDLIRNTGTPERWLSSVKDVMAKEAAQAEAAAQQAKLEQAKLASESARNLAAAPPALLARVPAGG